MMAGSIVTKGRFEPPVEQQVVAQDWADRGYDCRLFVDPPGQEWLGFTHTTNELVTVVIGLVEVRVDGLSAVLEPGDEIFIAKGARHDVINRANSESRWLFGYD